MSENRYYSTKKARVFVTKKHFLLRFSVFVWRSVMKRLELILFIWGKCKGKIYFVDVVVELDALDSPWQNIRPKGGKFSRQNNLLSKGGKFPRQDNTRPKGRKFSRQNLAVTWPSFRVILPLLNLVTGQKKVLVRFYS